MIAEMRRYSISELLASSFINGHADISHKLRLRHFKCPANCEFIEAFAKRRSQKCCIRSSFIYDKCMIDKALS